MDLPGRGKASTSQKRLTNRSISLLLHCSFLSPNLKSKIEWGQGNYLAILVDLDANKPIEIVKIFRLIQVGSSKLQIIDLV